MAPRVPAPCYSAMGFASSDTLKTRILSSSIAPQSDPAGLLARATELVAAGVDVIVAGYNPATIAAKTATTTIPIVGLIVLEPVETGIVKSLARPGGNVTGLTWEVGTEQVAKKLELFKQLAPKISRIATVWNPTVPGLGRYWKPFETAAAALGLASLLG